MSDYIVFEHATVLAATGADPIEDTTVWVEDGIIREVGPASSRTGSGTTIDCAGRTLMPGLIDAHVHIGCLEYHFEHQPRRFMPSLSVFLIAERMREMLDMGFTTVRDAGGADLGFKQAVERGLALGPALEISGRALSQTGGHGDMRARSEPGDVARWEGDFGMSIVIADGIDEVRKAVREQIRRGADWIKVMASGGAASPADKLNGTQYSVDELRVAVEEAAASGVRVMAHALPPPAIRNCVEAGVRSIEHGNFLDAETAVLMAEHDVFLVPTIATYELAARHPEVYGYNEEQRAKIDRAAEMSMDALRHARDAGVRIASGSDMLAGDLKAMAQELTFKAEVLGAAGAIESATRTSAELLGLEGAVGTIEPGRRADILVVDGDPLRDISILENRDALKIIMKSGSLYKQSLN